MRRAFLWFLPAGVAVATAGVFAAGFAAGMSGRLGVPAAQAVLPTPTPAAAPAPGGVFRIVALGDSLTRGAGDATGGYPDRVARALGQKGRPTVVENLAVDGSETGDVLRKVREPGTASTLARADLVLLSAGGNDLTHALRRIKPGGGESTTPLDDARRAASANLRAILAAIRAASPSAPIRLLGLYAPSGDAGSARRIEREGLLKWNVALEESSFTVPDCIVIPTADLFEGRPDRLAADRFHPGPSGYDEIAGRVVSTLVTSSSGGGSGRQSGK
jgi:lysophospholipase L1-like esterase